MTVLQDAAGSAAAGAPALAANGSRSSRSATTRSRSCVTSPRHARHHVPVAIRRGQPRHARVGLINERVQEDHAAYGIAPNPRHVDLPYPASSSSTPPASSRRSVLRELPRARYRHGLVAQAIGIVTTSSAPIAPGSVVTVRAWLDSPTYAWFQRVALTVEVSVAPGFHVYGQPAATGSAARRRDRPIAGLEVDSVTWPEPHRLVLPGLGDEMWVHDGTVRERCAHVHRGPGWWQPRHRHPRGLSGV